MSEMAEQEFWRRAWLQELGVEWRGPLPVVMAADGAMEPEPEAELESAAVAVAVAMAEPEDTRDDASEPVADVVAVPPEEPAARVEPVAPVAFAVAATPEPVVHAVPVSSVEPVAFRAVGPVAAESSAPASPPRAAEASANWSLPGPWRWSRWRGRKGAKLAQVLMLRPAEPPRASDAAAREVLAAAMAAVELEPMPRTPGQPAGGLREQALDSGVLHEFARQPWLTATAPLTVILCLPAGSETELAKQLGMAEVVPGAHWTLPGEPAVKLVLLPAPERLLEGATVKRVAWRALAPLRAG